MLKKVEQNIIGLAKELDLNLSKKNLENLADSVTAEKRFYTDVIGNELFLKAKLQEKIKVKRDLEREITTYKFLNKHSGKKRFFPKLLKNGKYKNVFWFLLEKEKGIFAGNMDENFGMKKEFLSKVSPSYFAKTIFSYQKIKPKFPLYRQGGWWYRQDFNYHKIKFLDQFINSKWNKNLISEKDAILAKKIIKKNKKLLDDEAKYLSHGDLYPNNLIFNDDNEFIILDWGLANLNNFSFDVAFVYLMAHRSTVWQKKFLKTYSILQKEDKFKNLFKIASISLSLRFADQYYRLFKKNPKKNLFSIFEKQIKIFQRSIYS